MIRHLTTQHGRLKPRPLQVAIVGMACRFPGTPDLISFWKNAVEAKTCTNDISAGRWKPSRVHNLNTTLNGHVDGQHVGNLDPARTLGLTRHGNVPRLVDECDPERSLVRDAMILALDDAGLAGGIADGRRVEVVVGRENNVNRGDLTNVQRGRVLTQTLAMLQALHPEWSDEVVESIRADLKSSLPAFEVGTNPGHRTGDVAGWVADQFDLSGASFDVNASSASSLIAIELGAQSLVARRADLVLVAGVNLQVDIELSRDSHRVGVVSTRDDAMPSSANVDAPLPGVGVGVLVLKRLADSERDGDRVYAVLQGIGLASVGKSAGLAATGGKGRVRAMRRAYGGSRINPTEVDYVDGHGFGESASDRAESRALRAIFPPRERGQRVFRAGAGSNGQPSPAVGMAGVIRAALALHHRVLLPTPNAETADAFRVDKAAPFRLLSKARPWINGDFSRPRRAGINAFGVAGMNAHAILEEHGASADGETSGCLLNWESEAILLGAPDRQGWVTLANALIDWLDSGQNRRVPLKDLAFTLNSGQGEFGFRVGLVVASTDDLRQRLCTLIERLAEAKCQSIRDARGTYFWEQPLYLNGTLAFLYPGEGSQYPGMLADLCPHFPEIRRVLDTSDRIALERGLDRLPSEQLFGEVNSTEAGLWEIGTAVNVVLSSQWALHQLLTKIGLKPGSVMGHSSGEILALAAAGVFEADRKFEDRIGDLGAVFERLEASGLVPFASLVAVASGREKVEAFCREHSSDVRIAIDNCPHQVVISGTIEAVSLITERMRAAGLLCEPLPFSRAYHTSAFALSVGPLREFFEQLPMKRPDVPVYSCASAARMSPDVASIRTLATRQWLSRVKFRDTVETMHADGVRLFVEVGSRGNLTGFVEDILRGKPHFAIAANLPRRSGITQLNHLVASLYAQGVPLLPELLYARRRPRLVDFSQDLDFPRESPVRATRFPELRLSEGLVERLHALRPRDEARFEPDALPSRSSLHPTSTGDLMNGEESGPALTIFANGSRIGPVPIEQLTPIGRAASNSSDSTLLTYFETMDAFLETQREVMEAYYRTGKGGTHGESPPQESPAPPLDAEPKILSHANTRKDLEAHHVSINDTIKGMLIELVSKRTGYPSEMLDLNHDMEADLGIDSIKRVEIFGEIQERGVAVEAVDLEKLSRCRTLGQVIDALGRKQQKRPSDPAWFGTIETLIDGRELVAIRRLDAATDPVARHHTVGGRHVSDIEPGRLGLPVVPFTVMAELLAQAAAILVPGGVVVGMRDVLASRWLSYEPGPVELEISAHRDPEIPDEVRVAMRNRNRQESRKNGLDEPTFSGTVIFSANHAPAELSVNWKIGPPSSCRFQPEELYRDQWLFHGPAFQALTYVGRCSSSAIEGTLKLLPRRELLPEPMWPRLHTDPIILDAFTHLLGCWGIDKRAGDEGDVMFPLRLASLAIQGEDPEIGTELDCRIQIKEVTRHRVKVDAEIVRPDGRVWYRLEGWEDWRFYWPERYRDVFRQPKTVLLGENIEHPAIPGDSMLVWLEPPLDMGKPVWKDVLDWVHLCPRERADFASNSRPKEDLFARIAAKEAARRLWLRRGDDAVYPADLDVFMGHDGRWVVSRLQATEKTLVAFATDDGLAIAIASAQPQAKLGVAVSLRSNDFSIDDLSGKEQAMLAGFAFGAVLAAEWVARIAVAKIAVMRSGGADDSTELTLVSIDVDSGEIRLRQGTFSIRCFTFLRAEHVAAWTVGERFAT